MTILGSASKAISLVTAAEMRQGALSAGWGHRRRDELEDLMRSYLMIGIDDETASEWAELAAACRATGSAQRDNDLWIAATAKRLGIPVASLDDDFSRIPGLDLIDASGVPRST